MEENTWRKLPNLEDIWADFGRHLGPTPFRAVRVWLQLNLEQNHTHQSVIDGLEVTLEQTTDFGQFGTQEHHHKHHGSKMSTCNLEAKHSQPSFPRLYWKVWTSCYSWLEIPVALTNQITSHYRLRVGILLSERGKLIAIDLWICVVWVLWSLRNKKFFEEAFFKINKVIEEIKGQF